MRGKIKTSLMVLVAGFSLVSGWFIWHAIYNAPAIPNQEFIPSINSAREIGEFIGLRVNVIGFLNCSGSKIPCWVRFYDGSSLPLSTDISDKADSGQVVEVKGLVYGCGFLDQCHGVILTDITAVDIVDIKRYANDSSYCERDVDCVVYYIRNCPVTCDSDNLSCCRYSINLLSKPYKPGDESDTEYSGVCENNKCVVGE